MHYSSFGFKFCPYILEAVFGPLLVISETFLCSVQNCLYITRASLANAVCGNFDKFQIKTVSVSHILY
jgi:hypothetical protein